MNSQVATKLRLLQQDGFLPASVVGPALLRELRPLVDAGVLRRVRSGAGWRWALRDAAALDALLGQRLPSIEGPLMGRVAGVARFRDSKSVANDTPPVVLARAFADNLVDPGGRACDAVESTRRHGVFAFVLGEASGYRVSGTVALVENPAVFLRCEELGLGAGLVICGNGRVHGRLLGWLAAHEGPGPRVLHLPDYDPVGLMEFRRLREALGERAALHLPGDLARRFSRYSNPRLLEGLQSRAMLARLRGSHEPGIREVVELIDRHNGGLEQESLLVPLG